LSTPPIVVVDFSADAAYLSPSDNEIVETREVASVHGSAEVKESVVAIVLKRIYRKLLGHVPRRAGNRLRPVWTSGPVVSRTD